ncbi:hypothetical protein CMI37_37955 [Candidatus Pacearchaeota archaeon]|jgi:hypothetical protein|nr:hypothetical protein [Candidatus Pacearchaeota archaeon]|tara:strand:- start:1099 stop:1293 length:195 start_codon:yes stop_codon:yes gene_type:complete
MGQRRINRGLARRDELRARSAERTEIRNKLTSQQQLRALDYRLGKGVGAVKERARLEALIDAGK